MCSAFSKPLILVVVAVLVVGLTYSSYSRSDVFALTRSPIKCEESTFITTCCQVETDDEGIEITWCTQCTRVPSPHDCGPRYSGSETGDELFFGTSPTPPPPGPKAPRENILPGSEVIQELTTPPSTPQPNETAPGVAPPTAPEADEEGIPRIIGESPSPTGYCVPLRTPTCIPCDPGLPGADCIPQTEWPPIRTTDEGPIEEKPLIPPTTGLFEETAPQVAPPTGEDGAGQPTEPLCPEGQVFDEETGLCVLDESTAEQQEQAAEEPAESQPEEEQPTEESDSGDGGNN